MTKRKTNRKPEPINNNERQVMIREQAQYQNSGTKPHALPDIGADCAASHRLPFLLATDAAIYTLSATNLKSKTFRPQVIP